MLMSFLAFPSFPPASADGSTLLHVVTMLSKHLSLPVVSGVPNRGWTGWGAGWSTRSICAELKKNHETKM